MRRSAHLSALILAGCAPGTIELLVPDAARTVVVAAPPATAQVQPITGSLAGALGEATPLMALFFADPIDALGVSVGALDEAHAPFPASVGEYVLDVDAPQWRPLASRPEWLQRRLQPRCPSLPLSIVALATTARGTELYGRIDGQRALARIDDRLVTIDAAGEITTLLDDVMIGVGDGFTDGQRFWLLGGRFGGASGRMLEGRLDAPADLVLIEPPGWPTEAGGVRRVDGAHTPAARPELIVATDLGWLLAYDGDRWDVRHQPRAPVREQAARVAWLGPDTAALAPSLLGGPRLLEVRGSTAAEVVVVEPRSGGEPEQVSALGRDLDGATLVGGDLGRVYRAAARARQTELVAEVSGTIHAIGASPEGTWTFGPLGLTHIDATGVACPTRPATPYLGPGRLVALDAALLFGGNDLIERAALPR